MDYETMDYEMHKVQKLLRKAAAEDRRDQSTFDEVAFKEFFADESEEAVREAWSLYQEHQSSWRGYLRRVAWFILSP
jgi:hypothetical protein